MHKSTQIAYLHFMSISFNSLYFMTCHDDDSFSRMSGRAKKDERHWTNINLFCRSVDADPRKQGMSGGSVLAHVTDANDAADEGGAPLGEPKKGERAERRDREAR
jgi:hypothetical protein